MAISIDHTTSPRTIFVPQADLTFISANLYSLDMEVFHNAVRTLQTLEANDIYPNTHKHTQQGTLGAVTYPRRIEITTEYQVEFEDGQYRVRLLAGDNNIEDVQVINQVSISTFNSAGNSVTVVGSGVTQQDKDDIENQIFARVVEGAFTFEQIIRLTGAIAAGDIEQDTDGSYIVRGLDQTTARILGQLAANNGRDVTGTDGT